MVPAPSVKVPRVSTYSGYRHVTSSFAYGAFTLSGWLSQNHSATLGKSIPRSEPRGARTPVWALPVSLAATPGIDVSFSSSGYLDVSVHRVPLHTLWIGVWIHEVCSCGFPHSDISGSMDICSSPKLFAAYHVFHRLLVPRHPPHNQLEGPRGNGFLPHMYSVTCVGSGQFFTLFSSKCCNCYNSFLFITITSDVLIFSSISYMRFSRYIADDPDISFSSNGEYEIRTRDLLLARQALSQLS